MALPENAEMEPDAKVITCVLYKGGGFKLIEALRKRGLTRANLHHARGSAIGDPVRKNGLPRQFEKEIVTVVTPAAQADELFEFLYHEADIKSPRGGFLYMRKAVHATPFLLPDLPAEHL